MVGFGAWGLGLQEPGRDGYLLMLATYILRHPETKLRFAGAPTP